MECKRIEKFTTSLPPCCVQYHPENSTVLLIATYHLENEVKTGSIDIYTHEDECKLHSQIKTNAILDLKFNQGGNLVVTADSDGKVILWSFDVDVLKLTHKKTIQVFDQTATSVNFAANDKVIVTCTDGRTAILDLNTLDIDLFSKQHDMECWISDRGKLGLLDNIIFTGGDDSQLIAHDLRTLDMVWSNRRIHDAGVVSILAPNSNWNSNHPTHLWTGSYDDRLRILDVRKGQIELQKENLGGGVWRLIPRNNRVLVCCMYDGARIINVDGEGFKVDKYFKGDHESMCYGGAWKNDDTITTCSFYDKIVQVWDPSS